MITRQDFVETLTNRELNKNSKSDEKSKKDSGMITRYGEEDPDKIINANKKVMTKIANATQNQKQKTKLRICK